MYNYLKHNKNKVVVGERVKMSLQNVREKHYSKFVLVHVASITTGVLKGGRRSRI